jgi:2-aminoethylphosphonate transport system permease protein
VTALLDAPAPAADVPQRPSPVRSRAALWTIPPLLVVLVVVVYPLARVFLESAKVIGTQGGWATWTGVLASGMFRDALWRTVAIAASSRSCTEPRAR